MHVYIFRSKIEPNQHIFSNLSQNIKGEDPLQGARIGAGSGGGRQMLGRQLPNPLKLCRCLRDFSSACSADRVYCLIDSHPGRYQQTRRYEPRASDPLPAMHGHILSLIERLEKAG